jgi:hypothetical protein
VQLERREEGRGGFNCGVKKLWRREFESRDVDRVSGPCTLEPQRMT